MMTVDQMIEVLTAYKAGKEIEVKYRDENEWTGIKNPAWTFDIFDYRVKPEPKVIWVNEYPDGSGMAYPTEGQAMTPVHNRHTSVTRVAVRYVESPEE